MAKITIEVDKTGKSTISVEGASGKQCLDLTRDLENALGTVETRSETEEMKGARLTSQHQHTNKH